MINQSACPHGTYQQNRIVEMWQDANDRAFQVRLVLGHPYSTQKEAAKRNGNRDQVDSCQRLEHLPGFLIAWSDGYIDLASTPWQLIPLCGVGLQRS